MTRYLDRVVSPRVRDYLDSWQFWISVLGLGLMVGFVWLAVLQKQATRSEARAAAERAVIAERVRVSAQSTYQACVTSIPVLKGISNHLAGTYDLADTLVRNSRAVVEATPMSDPTRKARVANLVRITAARTKIAEATSLPVPTRAQCTARRAATLADIRP